MPLQLKGSIRNILYWCCNYSEILQAIDMQYRVQSRNKRYLLILDTRAIGIEKSLKYQYCIASAYQ